MSKRLQVLFPDSEYKQLLKICRQQAKTVAEWVRESLRQSLDRALPEAPDTKLAKILKYAKATGPTGDIDQILSQIEAGRDQLP